MRERKVSHRYAISDPQFRREISVLLGPAIARGNQVTALQNGNEIFPAMLRTIRSAQTSDMRSLRLNDEASLNIDSSDFATRMTAVFETDLLQAESYSLARWQGRPLREKFSEKLLLPVKSQL